MDSADLAGKNQVPTVFLQLMKFLFYLFMASPHSMWDITQPRIKFAIPSLEAQVLNPGLQKSWGLYFRPTLSSRTSWLEEKYCIYKFS